MPTEVDTDGRALVDLAGRWIERIWRAMLAPLIAAGAAILISSILYFAMAYWCAVTGTRCGCWPPSAGATGGWSG